MIFCVEDDSGIRDLMIYTLNAAGFEAVGFGDDAAFWEAMKQQRQIGRASCRERV